LGHELSGKFDVAHGASLTTMWGAWARYVAQVNSARFLRLGEKVWEINTSGTAGVEAVIKRTEDFFRSIEMPTNFTELGIGSQPAEVLEAMAESCVFQGKRKVGSFKPLEKADVLAIYTTASTHGQR